MRHFRFVFLGLLLFVALPGMSRSGEPTEQLRTTADEVLRIVTSPQFQSKTDERRRLLRKAVEPRFDFTEMSKRAMGLYWRKMTPEQQQEFVRLFRDLLEYTYAGTIDSYKYRGEKVLYIRENLDDPYAEVGTKIIKGQQEYAVDYRMLKIGDQWKVYDIAIEGVSLVNNFRSQFTRILTNSSIPELIERLREKQKELRSH
jgi:phospholipid transport system substrate-binding protein